MSKDLCRGPYANNTPMNATQAFLMRNPYNKNVECKDK